MDFPNMIYGDYGDEKVAQSTKIGSLALGTRMLMPGGEIFAYTRNGGTTLVRGNLVQSIDTVDNNDSNQELTATSVGATSVAITLGDAAVTLNQYEDGYLIVNDGTPEGELYKIKTNLSAAASSSCVFSFADGNYPVTAFEAATTEVGLRVNEFTNVTIWRGGTIEGIPCGIVPRAVTGSQYFWVQRRGEAGCLVAGTHVLGVGVVPSDDGTDGALDVQLAASAAATIWETESIGYCMTVQSSTEYGMCYLTLE